jgi:hypothetical protein
MASPGYMNRKPRKINELIIDVKRYARLFISGLFIAAISTCPPCLGEAMRRGSIVYITIFMLRE